MAARRKKKATRRKVTKRRVKRVAPKTRARRRVKVDTVYYHSIIFALIAAIGLGLFWKGLWDVSRGLTGAESFVIGLGLLFATAIGYKIVK